MRVAAVAGIVVATAFFSFAEGPKHAITLADLENLHRVSNVAISPDGKQVAYSTGGELYVVDVETSTPTHLASGVAPSWSPDGRTLAYYDEHGDSFQLGFFDLSQHKAVASKISVGLDPSAVPAWSPDGTRLLVTAEVQPRKSDAVPVPDSVPLVISPKSPPWLASSGLFRGSDLVREKVLAKRQVLMILPDGDALSGISQDDENAAEPVWSPDGKAIVFLVFHAERHTAELVRFDLVSGNRQLLAKGSNNMSSPRWSSDGRDIAYSDLADKYGLLTAAFIVPALSGHQPLNVSKALDRNIEDMEWLPDQHSLLVIIRDGVNQPLGTLSINGKFKSLSQGDAARRMLAVASRGSVAWVQSDPEHLDRVFVKRLDSPDEKPVVDPNPQIGDWQQGSQRVVSWRNSRGEALEGILVLPPDYMSATRCPLIVDPYSHRLNEFMGIPMLANQYLAAQGYALFFPNHRGFFVFPKALKGDLYARVAQRQDSVEIMADDVLSGVDRVVAMGFADPNRMALYGFSTGASAVDSLLTATTRFKAAISTGGVADWLHYYLLRPTDDDTIPSMLNGRTPWEMRGLYPRLSPVYSADRVYTPLLLAIGDQDTRLLDSVSFYHALRRLNRPVVLVRYPDQAHGFWGAALEDYWSRCLGFLKEHGI